MSSRVRLLALVAVIVGTCAVSTVAWGYVSGHGGGTGSSSSGSPQPVTVVAAVTGTVTSSLYPGASADLVVEVSNPNSYTVTIVSVAQGTGSVTAAGGVGSCTNTGVSVPTRTGLSVAVASGNQVVHIPNGAVMDVTSDSGCQGASFQIPVTITVQR